MCKVSGRSVEGGRRQASYSTLNYNIETDPGTAVRRFSEPTPDFVFDQGAATRAVGAFPDRASALRLITTVALTVPETWASRRYMDLALSNVQAIAQAA